LWKALQLNGTPNHYLHLLHPPIEDFDKTTSRNHSPAFSAVLGAPRAMTKRRGEVKEKVVVGMAQAGARRSWSREPPNWDCYEVRGGFHNIAVHRSTTACRIGLG
jgi:hypothetical protein